MRKQIFLFLCVLVLLVSACNTKAVAAIKKADPTTLVVIEAVLPTQNVVLTCLEIFPPPVQLEMILNIAGGKKVIKDDATLGDAKDDPHLFIAAIAVNGEETLLISSRAKGLSKDDDAFNVDKNFVYIVESNITADIVKKEVQLE